MDGLTLKGKPHRIAPMIDRRRLLLTAAAVTLAPAPVLASGGDGSRHDQLNALFDRFVDEGLDRSPEGVTSLGLDTGKRAHQKSELGDRSLKAADENYELGVKQLAALDAFGRHDLSPADEVSFDVVRFGLVVQADAGKRFAYAGRSPGSPYVLNQLTGAYHDLPDFLDSQHRIETKADAEAYLARLEALSTAIDQDSEQARHDAGLGVFGPDFVLDKTLKQLRELRGAPADKAVLVQSLVRRTAEKKIDGDWAAAATKVYEEKVRPALDRQIFLAEALRAKAVHDAGCWRLPDGDAYYQASLVNWTTSSRPAEEIHQLGLDLVAKLTARMDELMRAQGLTQGTVGQRLRGMYEDPRFRYPNTDEGKEKLLADLNQKVRVVQAKLPQWFGALPKAGVEIKRVPKYTEAGSPGGYYNQGSLDGKRPGAYYINLRDTSEVPSWTLPTLTYHEAIPGHHLQGTIALEADTPLIRKLSFFSGYIEGWALYAEQLADEMGMYENDPWGRIGYLHDAGLRAVRLVVDTGMHRLRWTREKAIKYFVDTIGDKDESATTEVERYCVWPGQACSYMLGKLEWLKLREAARAQLGDRFDIRKFHDAGLLSGATPLEVLDTVIGDWIKTQRA
jgi:uncharacterized protein (DUF885 family)